jgi:hypothetical protein
MQQAYNVTGNPRALQVLARLNRILQDQARLASDYGSTGSQTDKVAVFAIGEIQKALPKNARVWIYNNANTNLVAVGIVDNITSGFIRQGIGVVDRQSAGLIEAEQKFQMSGYVSDNDLLSICQAAGANTLVVVDITGTGSMRRLSVRVLDIESRISIMQSDTSERWQL